MAANLHQRPPGPPYPPTSWALGGIIEPQVDVPITSVFLGLFVVGAGAHMAIFQMNRAKGHKFLFSGLLFGTISYFHVEKVS
jgi:hypothetical protein